MAMRIVNNGKSEGGMAMASLLTVGTAITTGDLVKGTFYYVKAKGEASALPVGAEVGLPFQAPSAITLGAGDEVYPLTFKHLGFARDKSSDSSKNAIDSTTDVDYPFTSTIMEEAISKTGSVSGYMMLDAKDSALMSFLGQFENLVFADDTGLTITKPSSPVVLLAIDWLAKTYGVAGPKAGDARHIDFLPVLLSNSSANGSKGSTVTLSFNYTGQPTTDDGLMSAKYVGPHYAAEA